MLTLTHRSPQSEEQSLFRDAVRGFVAREATPNLVRWDRQNAPDAGFWTACGRAGLLCPGIPEAAGGLGLDFRFNAVVVEEFGYAGASTGITVHSDVVPDYLVRYGTAAVQAAWLPRLIAGTAIAAIGLTEPDAGSDLRGLRTTARAHEAGFTLSGAKTYITNGTICDVAIVAARIERDGGPQDIGLFVVDAHAPGLTRGPALAKIGQHAGATAELFLDDVRVPADHRLGAEYRGMAMLTARLPQERLVIAVMAQAMAQRAIDEATAFTRHRVAFGRPILDLQTVRHTLASFTARLQVGWAHLDWAIDRHVAGRLTAAEAAAAKLWHTELLWACCDEALQLHGGAGYMTDQMIARLWADARVQRIYGGTSEYHARGDRPRALTASAVENSACRDRARLAGSTAPG